jgi:hypothetical protein
VVRGGGAARGADSTPHPVPLRGPTLSP